MATSLFVLFREYFDHSHAPSSSCIQCTSGADANEQLAYCEKWLAVIRFFKYETCNRFYDYNNVKSMLYPYILLESEFGEQEIEYPNLASYIRTEFKKEGLVDWRDEYDDNDEHVQMYFYNGVDVTNDTFGEIIRVKKSYPAILLNCEALRCPSQINVSSNDGQTYYIDCVSDIQALHKWFSSNRLPRRVFVYNPKHGDKFRPSEYISGTNRKAARLEATCEEAQRLLDLAISTSPTDSFWYYDAQVGKYIYFENQQEIRLAFHGYHLSPGEENYDNIGREKLAKIL